MLEFPQEGRGNGNTIFLDLGMDRRENALGPRGVQWTESFTHPVQTHLEARHRALQQVSIYIPSLST